jgi:hypothetical protein
MRAGGLSRFVFPTVSEPMMRRPGASAPGANARTERTQGVGTYRVRPIANCRRRVVACVIKKRLLQLSCQADRGAGLYSERRAPPAEERIQTTEPIDLWAEAIDCNVSTMGSARLWSGVRRDL